MRIIRILILILLLVGCESPTPGVDDDNYTAGVIVVFLIFGFLFIAGIIVKIDDNSKSNQLRSKMNKGLLTWDDYYKSKEIDNPNLHKELMNHLEKKDDDILKMKANEALKNKTLYNSDYKLKTILTELEQKTHQCNRCYNDEMRIWNLNKSLIELRCEDCKKKFKYVNDDFTDFNLNEIVNAISLFEDRIDLENSNHYIRKSTITLDYEGYKRNSPKTYPYVINCDLYPLESVKRKNKVVDDKGSRRISQEVKDAVWRRDEGKCIECGTNKNLEFDHIIPHSKGGANTYRNIQLLCEKCNRKKSDKIG